MSFVGVLRRQILYGGFCFLCHEKSWPGFGFSNSLDPDRNSATCLDPIPYSVNPDITGIIHDVVIKGKYKITSVVDPYWFHCGSGSSFLSQCRSVSREQNQCGSDPGQSQKVEFFHEKYT
jgi:hypothetical protein